MPEKKTLERAEKDKREGKAASTQAGEFVREEIHHVREGKHGARSSKQAIAIGLSKARRAGVELPAPEEGAAPEKTREQAERELRNGKSATKPSSKRSRAREKGSQARTAQSCIEGGAVAACQIRCAQTHEGRALGFRKEGSQNTQEVKMSSQ